MIWAIFTALFLIALFLEAWYDWLVDSGKSGDFLVDRLRKVAKGIFLLAAFFGGWFLQWQGLVLYIALRILFFDFFYYSLRFGRVFLDLKYYWMHSEFYYWILIIIGRAPAKEEF